MNKSKIEWTDYTVNFWHGCQKVDKDCKNCYMYREKEKYGQDGNIIVKRNFDKIRKELVKLTDPQMIFTCSWSDFFLKEADQWRDEALQIIKEYPQHIWQILTKRPERIKDELPDNVWLIISAGNQKSLNERMKYLPNIKAKIKGLSCEPLLEPLSIYDYRYIDWIIIGGESGNEKGKYRYRPCNLIWISSIVYYAQQAKVPIFVKQLGTHLAKQLKLKNKHGRDINEFPEYLKVREYPDV